MLNLVIVNVGNSLRTRISIVVLTHIAWVTIVTSASKVSYDLQTKTWHSWLTFYGNMLRERRKELNLTQKQLAEKLDREQSYIARVENGKADIQLSSFFRIAAVLGIQFIPTYVN